MRQSPTQASSHFEASAFTGAHSASVAAPGWSVISAMLCAIARSAACTAWRTLATPMRWPSSAACRCATSWRLAIAAIAPPPTPSATTNSGPLRVSALCASSLTPCRLPHALATAASMWPNSVVCSVCSLCIAGWRVGAPRAAPGSSGVMRLMAVAPRRCARLAMEETRTRRGAACWPLRTFAHPHPNPLPQAGEGVAPSPPEGERVGVRVSATGSKPSFAEVSLHPPIARSPLSSRAPPPRQRQAALRPRLLRRAEQHRLADLPDEVRAGRVRDAVDDDAVVAMHEHLRTALVDVDDVQV